MAIVDAKVNCIWMRHLYCYERQLSVADARGDYGRDLRVRLEHHDKIDIFSHKSVRICQRDVWAMLTVQEHNVHSRTLSTL